MKTLINTTNKNLIATILFAVIILLSGCKKNTLTPGSSISNHEQTIDRTQSATGEISLTFHKTVDLIEGEHLSSIGKVEVTDLNNGTVEVKYSVNAPWKLHSIKLYVGSLVSLPINEDGECITDLFPYKKILTVGPTITSTSVLLPKNAIPMSGIVAAYAKIINTETLSVPIDSWGYGTPVTSGGMSMYFNYHLIYQSPPVQINPIKEI